LQQLLQQDHLACCLNYRFETRHDHYAGLTIHRGEAVNSLIIRSYLTLLKKAIQMNPGRAPNKKPPEGGFLRLGGPGLNRTGLRMRNPSIITTKLQAALLITC
jgi:hypothetical protein